MVAIAKEVDITCYIQQTLGEPRTALLLSILRDDKMTLFQEVIVTKLAVTQSTTCYQMKAMAIIFPMSICGLSNLDTTALQSRAFFQKKSKGLKNAPFSQGLKTCFGHTFL